MAKGRSKKLIELRNTKLIARYYFWSEIKRRRYDDVLTILSEQEFFLSEATIMRIIYACDDQLQKLMEKGGKNIQTKMFQ